MLIGRVFHTMAQIPQAINFLRQGLAIAQSLNRSEEEAKIRHRFGNFHKNTKMFTKLIIIIL